MRATRVARNIEADRRTSNGAAASWRRRPRAAAPSGSSEIPGDYIGMIRLPAERDLLPCREGGVHGEGFENAYSQQLREGASSQHLQPSGRACTAVVIGVSPASLNRMGASLMLA